MLCTKPVYWYSDTSVLSLAIYNTQRENSVRFTFPSHGHEKSQSKMSYVALKCFRFTRFFYFDIFFHLITTNWRYYTQHLNLAGTCFILAGCASRD